LCWGSAHVVPLFHLKAESTRANLSMPPGAPAEALEGVFVLSGV